MVLTGWVLSCCKIQNSMSFKDFFDWVYWSILLMALQYSPFDAEFNNWVISSYKSTIILFLGTFEEYFMIDAKRFGHCFKICLSEKMSIRVAERHRISAITSCLARSSTKQPFWTNIISGTNFFNVPYFFNSLTSPSIAPYGISSPPR